jgi:hypothetical protein
MSQLPLQQAPPKVHDAPVPPQHWPFLPHVCPEPVHVPHDPPQPSSPQTLPLQLGVHTHWFEALQVELPVQ